jgi:putative spermidine/putrescine transport system ATP-binding protein
VSVTLNLDEVSVELGGTEVLHGISFEVERGEFVTLLGPSGSGKTTTLNAIAGLVSTSGGHVRFDGKSVERRPAHDRDIGIVFQSYALFPHMSVGQNIAFPLLTRKVRRARSREIVAKMLELVQLSGTETRSISSLSGGQQQRVALARALAPSPSVLLLDEPLAALDKQLRETMQHELKRIQSEVGVTTVAVTHDQTEALTMSDRVAILRDGHVDQIDTPEALYRRPATLFAARFLGETNLIAVREGRLEHFGSPAPLRTGTAILRPEDLGLATEADPSLPSITASIVTASFQGNRYRVAAEDGDRKRIIVTLPSTTDPTKVAPGLALELALLEPDAVHVLPEEAVTDTSLAGADLVPDAA